LILHLAAKAATPAHGCGAMNRPAPGTAIGGPKRRYSMIPKSENRFSEKIMLNQENLRHDPIQLSWFMA